ncbi:MAG: hypothetical protein Q9188_001752 [Gyalolechia gomerana]
MPAAIKAHVPAWKRLGLKLKEVPAGTGPAREVPQHTPATQKKRKSEFEDIGLGVNSSYEKPAKKPKKSRDHTESSTVTPNGRESAVSPAATAAKPALTRKSVSFTPETKTQDGDSNKDLYNSWITTQKSSDPSFDPSTYRQNTLKSVTPPKIKPPTRNPPASEINTTSKPAEQIGQKKKKEKKKKKRNKSKSTTLSLAASPTTKLSSTTASPPPSAIIKSQSTPHLALIYLTTYHTSRQTWKFSKSRSSYLLRHCFSPTHIPTSYNPALNAYLQGLQSSGARRRLVDEALVIRKEDEEWLGRSSPVIEDSQEEGEEGNEKGKGGWKEISDSLLVGEAEKDTMDDPAERKELFLRAVAEHESLLRDREDAKEEAEKEAIWRAKVERRMRAEMVLGIFEDLVGGVEGGGLGVRDRVPEHGMGDGTVNGNGVGGQKALLPGGKEKVKRKRKRKRRTTGVRDDESSSSSSSSSSSTSESGSEYGDGDHHRKKTKVGTITVPNGHSQENAVDLTAETSSEGTSDSDTSSSRTSGSDPSSESETD